MAYLSIISLILTSGYGIAKGASGNLSKQYIAVLDRTYRFRYCSWSNSVPRIIVALGLATIALVALLVTDWFELIPGRDTGIITQWSDHCVVWAHICKSEGMQLMLKRYG